MKVNGVTFVRDKDQVVSTQNKMLKLCCLAKPTDVYNVLIPGCLCFLEPLKIKGHILCGI